MDPIGRALEKTQRPTPIHTRWSKTTEIAGHGTSTPIVLGEMYLLLLVNHILEHSFLTGTTPYQLGDLLLPLLPSTLDT